MDKHLDDFSPDLQDQDALASWIEQIMASGGDEAKTVNGKTIWWTDEEGGIVVIFNPLDPGGGTAFHPDLGHEYYECWPNPAPCQ